ncbi:WecB/TagA/CpsF family glycosyltransferase [Microbacterium atlanticum]|uniref:WecB/TagA/CpsF family glycosyltransferase n=1 Tax=Microbacterium atlanticum TaxID=2782168 RepID=UPI003B5860DD
MSAHDDAEYATLVQTRGISFADGTPIAALIRLRRRDKASAHVRGPSAFEYALRRSAGRDVRHFFIGATPDTLTKLQEVVESRFPQALVVGTWAPPFGPLTGAIEDEAVARIEASGANLVWVGMGSPRQDFASDRIARRCGVMAAGVGAAFDFMAGTVPEAPPALRKLGLEWFFRLLTEPRRLWRRYLVGNTRFLAIAAQSSRMSRSVS